MAIPSSSSQIPSSSQSQNPTLDRSHSAPAPPPGPDLPHSLNPEQDASSPLSDHPLPPPLQSEPNLSPASSPSSDMLHTCTPPARIPTESQNPSGGAPPETTAAGVKSELPMDQEVHAAGTTEADSVEMECPPASAEREQPEGDRCSSSDSIPSLAAALKELHELLVQSQNRSISCSPSHPQGQDSGEASPEPSTPMPENTQPAPPTANATGAETCDAKANYAASASDEEPSQCLVPDPPGRVERLLEVAAETGEGLGPPRRPDSSEDTSQLDREEACPSRASEPEPEVPPVPAALPEFREPPEGQHGRGVADGQASGTNTPDTLQPERAFLSPASAAVSPPEEVPSTSPSSSAPLLAQAPPSPAPHPPSPHPLMEQFPAEHIQRIQAAGFSASEAVEALEQAHGVVEIALLALLARSITVPT